jgi:hypothetical protein
MSDQPIEREKDLVGNHNPKYVQCKPYNSLGPLEPKAQDLAKTSFFLNLKSHYLDMLTVTANLSFYKIKKGDQFDSISNLRL